MIAGNNSMPTHDGTTTMIGNTGNGYVKITFLEPVKKTDAELAFGSLSDFRKITREDCTGYSNKWGTYDDLYAGNNDELEYNEDGSINFDEDNPILYMELDESKNNLFDESYSMYFTINADLSQPSGTIASIGDGNTKYKSWIRLLKGYLQIYSYYEGSAGGVSGEHVEPGLLSIDVSEYSNQVMNIQITANKTGETKLYINGELQKTFTSGGADILTTHVTIGDLRPLRNLKFIGTIYDFSMYDIELTEEEIQNNWKYAKYKWIDT